MGIEFLHYAVVRVMGTIGYYWLLIAENENFLHLSLNILTFW